MRKKILFIGNGLNRLVSGYSWKNLIEDLGEFVGYKNDINRDFKPFPLLYEELYFNGKNNKGFQEHEIKQYIKGKLEEIKYSDLHDRCMSLGFPEILTTNYDYTLEYSHRLNPYVSKNNTEINEKKYSLFRNKTIGKYSLWHIHGEIDNIYSIMLGYEHYSGYLEKIRHYYFSNSKYVGKEIINLKSRLENKNSKIESWVDHFFINDIFVIGFSFNYSEMPIWWILNYRARNKLIKRINNHVTFVFPSFKSRELEPRIQLLNSLSIETKEISTTDSSWQNFYEDAFDYLANQLNHY